MAVMEYGSETAREIDAIWRRSLTDIMNAQNEVRQTLQNANQRWLTRIQSAAELSSAFTSRLIAARSPLDAYTAWQEMASQWLKISAENWQQLFSDGQKIGEVESRLVAATDVTDE